VAQADSWLAVSPLGSKPAEVRIGDGEHYPRGRQQPAGARGVLQDYRRWQSRWQIRT